MLQMLRRMKMSWKYSAVMPFSIKPSKSPMISSDTSLMFLIWCLKTKSALRCRLRQEALSMLFLAKIESRRTDCLAILQRIGLRKFRLLILAIFRSSLPNVSRQTISMALLTSSITATDTVLIQVPIQLSSSEALLTTIWIDSSTWARSWSLWNSIRDTLLTVLEVHLIRLTLTWKTYLIALFWELASKFMERAKAWSILRLWQTILLIKLDLGKCSIPSPKKTAFGDWSRAKPATKTSSVQPRCPHKMA